MSNAPAATTATAATPEDLKLAAGNLRWCTENGQSLEREHAMSLAARLEESARRLESPSGETAKEIQRRFSVVRLNCVRGTSDQLADAINNAEAFALSCIPESPSEPPRKTVAREDVEFALGNAWNDFVTDTSCFPDCFDIRGRNLHANFEQSRFAEDVADWLNIRSGAFNHRPASQPTESPAVPDRSVEDALAEVESAAIDDHYACSDCKHSGCQADRERLLAARVSLLKIIGEREQKEKENTERWREIALGTPPGLFPEDLRALMQELAALRSTPRETTRDDRRVKEMLTMMLETDEALYTRILDTPKFAFAFNEICKLAAASSTEQGPASEPDSAGNPDAEVTELILGLSRALQETEPELYWRIASKMNRQAYAIAALTTNEEK